MNKVYIILLIFISVFCCNCETWSNITGLELYHKHKEAKSRMLIELEYLVKYQKKLIKVYHDYLLGKIVDIKNLKTLGKKLDEVSLSIAEQGRMEYKIGTLYNTFERILFNKIFYKTKFTWEKKFVLNNRDYFVDKFLDENNKLWDEFYNLCILSRDLAKKIKNDFNFIKEKQDSVIRSSKKHLVKFLNEKFFALKQVQKNYLKELTIWQTKNMQYKVEKPLDCTQWLAKLAFPIQVDQKDYFIFLKEIINNLNLLRGKVNYRLLVLGLTKSYFLHKKPELLHKEQEINKDIKVLVLNIVKQERHQVQLLLSYYNNKIKTLKKKLNYENDYIVMIENKVFSLEKKIRLQDEVIIKLKEDNKKLKKILDDIIFEISNQNKKLKILLNE